MEKMHHPKADVDRMYLPRSSGGRGLTQLELTSNTSTIRLDAYLTKNNDPLLQIVKQHDKKKKLYSIKIEAVKFKSELDCSKFTPSDIEATTLYAK